MVLKYESDSDVLLIEIAVPIGANVRGDLGSPQERLSRTRELRSLSVELIHSTPVDVLVICAAVDPTSRYVLRNDGAPSAISTARLRLILSQCFGVAVTSAGPPVAPPAGVSCLIVARRSTVSVSMVAARFGCEVSVVESGDWLLMTPVVVNADAMQSGAWRYLGTGIVLWRADGCSGFAAVRGNRVRSLFRWADPVGNAATRTFASPSRASSPFRVHALARQFGVESDYLGRQHESWTGMPAHDALRRLISTLELPAPVADWARTGAAPPSTHTVSSASVIRRAAGALSLERHVAIPSSDPASLPAAIAWLLGGAVALTVALAVGFGMVTAPPATSVVAPAVFVAVMCTFLAADSTRRLIDRRSVEALAGEEDSVVERDVHR